MYFATIVWDQDPFVFQSEFFSLRWYALAFVLAIPLAYFLFAHFVKREGKPRSYAIGLTEYGLFGVLIGARLGQVFLYEWDYFSQHPLEIFQIWKGGLASHGALVGTVITSYLFAKRKELDFLWVLDRGAIVVCFCAGLARIGNLFNSEIYGIPTTVDWAFVFTKVDKIPRHPSQLYDAALVFVLGSFLLLLYEKFKPLPKGLLFGLFFAVGFGLRTYLEYWKEGADFTSMYSIPVILAGIVISFFAFRAQWGHYEKH